MAQFEEQLAKAVRAKDGAAVAKLVSITQEATFQSKTEELCIRALRQQLGQHEHVDLWADVGLALWKRHEAQDEMSRYKAQNALLIAVNRVADKCDRWIIPVFRVSAQNLRKLAMAADAAGSASMRRKSNSVCLEETTRTINKAFTLCLNDRNPVRSKSRKWGVYLLVGELLKIYLKLGNTALARSVLKVLQQQEKQLPSLNNFPKSHVVTYLYHTGVLQLIQGDYVKAALDLGQALELCPSNPQQATHQKEAILLYLIPAQLLNSRKTPSNALWLGFSRLECLYRPLITSLMTGNIKQFDADLLERRGTFIKKHIFVPMSKIRVLVFTRLFRQVYVAHDQSNRIATPTFSRALMFALDLQPQQQQQALQHKDGEEKEEKTKKEGDNSQFPEDASGEQVECYLTNMICTGQMKGYISRPHQMLVLSNKEAFPKVHGKE